MNKSVVISLTIIISLLCLFYISFTFQARKVRQDAIEFATNKKTGIVDNQKKQRYLDSVWNKPVYNFLGYEFTYKDVKSKELALGLDLQGGMHVTLEVSPVEIIQVLAGNSSDSKFKEALKLAQKRQKDSQSGFVSLFGEAYKELVPNGKLAKIFTNTNTKGKIDFNSSDSEVLSVIQAEVDEANNRAFQIVRTRIDKFGVTNPNIMKLPGTGRILVELPGVDNPERVRTLLTGVAKLEFLEVWETQDLLPYLEQFNNYVQKEDAKNQLKKGKTTEKQTDLTAKSDTVKEDGANALIAGDEEKKEEAKLEAKDSTKTEKKDSLATKPDSTKKADSTKAKKDTTKADTTKNTAANFLLMPSYEGFTVKVKDIARVNELLARSEVKSIFPSNLKLLYDVKANEKDGVITMYPIKKSRTGKAQLEGDVIVSATQDFDEKASPSVSMQMNATGAKIWKKMTGANIGKRIAIALDEYVYSAPRVNGEIPTGNSQISGNFTIEEAKDLANVLKSGKLPAPTRIVEEATVGPSLGLESINQGLFSMMVGLGIVVLFMLLYYRGSGLVANVALLFNIFFIIGILAQFGAVLTLAGMAGIVLTIGMSVDANVLIFERIKEELRHNKPMHVAIKLGYEKALSSIIDGNVTTFLIAAILYTFGAGGIKGFAITLMIGIGCSLFSAIFITRIIIEYFTRKNPNGVSFDGLILKNLFRNANYNFISLRKAAYIFSSAFIVIGLVIALIRGGLNLGVDFKGGRSYVVEFNAPISVNQARTEVSKQFEGSTEVKTFGGNNKLKITTSAMIEDESASADKKVEAQLLKGLEKFKDKKPTILSFSKVGATIADDIANTAYLTILVSLIVIFLYILIRFNKWQYGAGAVVALFHDVLFVIAGTAIANMLGIGYEVDQVFIAAILTVIGYSINDTVVVFDRIREFAGDTEQKGYGEKMNAAINDTLSRTIMTSGTTLIVILALFLFGGQVLGAFSFALLVGIGIGTYSSVFIASPIVLDISLLQIKKKAVEKPAAKA